MGSKLRTPGSVRRLLIYAVALVLFIAVVRTGLCLTSRSLNVVEVPLGKGTYVKPVMTNSKSGETFTAMVKRTKPYAAINGTFYDENLRPLGDLVAGGKIIHRGHYRNGVAFKSDGSAHFLRVSKGRLDWRGYTSGIAAGPRLIHNGKVALDPVADGFSRRSLTLSAYRSGIAKTKSGKLLLVTSKQAMTFAEFAKALLDLGAVEALNLDGGGACALYENGRYLAQPYLPMTNILVVYLK